ncbi:50S ribosomal protein L23 [bacterium SM23_57]|nr:MAG: 50S ribosomal protein L23 [bacterium SM23_57]
MLKRPLLTEKITKLQDANNQYAFEVDRRANKIEIKRAIEKRFDVHVLSVRTMNVKGKMKTLGRFTGRRPDWKKAVITVKPGEELVVFENV